MDQVLGSVEKIIHNPVDVDWLCLLYSGHSKMQVYVLSGIYSLEIFSNLAFLFQCFLLQSNLKEFCSPRQRVSINMFNNNFCITWQMSKCFEMCLRSQQVKNGQQNDCTA